MIIVMIVGIAAGMLLGFGLNITYPSEYSLYITMALLAAIDSMLGAVRSEMEGRYNNLIFVSGFVTNALLAALLTYLGDRLGVPLYYATILVFGGRLFNNLAVCRRLLIDKYFLKKQTVEEQEEAGEFQKVEVAEDMDKMAKKDDRIHE